MAGNAFEGGLTYVDGKYYIYHNDEWYHGGIHRWRVDGLDTLQVTDTPVAWNSANYDGTPDPYDLLAGLPFDTMDLPDNTAGWHRSPTADIATDIRADWFSVYTNSYNYNPLDSPDLAFQVCGSNVTRTLYKDLPRSHSGNWSIDSTVVWPFVGSSSVALYVDVLDAAGKVILRLDN